MRGYRIILVSLLYLLDPHLTDAFSGQFEPGGKPEVEVVYPSADVQIGILLNIRKRGLGLFGCGERRIDGLTTGEAIRWVTDELNKKIWSSSSSNVSIGLRIMDSCSRTRIATSQLTEFLPELKEESNASMGSLPLRFAIIDDIGLDKETDVSNALKEQNIPVIKTDININSQQETVNAVLNMVQELRWNHIALIHDNSHFSISMLKSFTKSLKKFDLCVPWIVNVEISVIDNDLTDFEHVLRSGIPIVALMSSEKHDLLLRNLRNIPKHKHKVPMLFTDLIMRDNLKNVPGNSVHLLALVALPEKEAHFEEFFWKRAKVNRHEDDLEILQRTKTLRQMMAVMDKISTSLSNLINDYCPNRNKLCAKALSVEARNTAFEQLNDVSWSEERSLYGLMEYQFRNPEGHVLLHKIVTYNKFKNVDVFDKNLPFVDMNCESFSKAYRPECNCLEAKNLRRGSARNIVDRKDLLPAVEKLNTDASTSGTPVKKEIEHFSNIPTAFSSFRDPINAILACLILLGSFFTLFTGQYFATFAALPHGGLTTGTSIIGYVILIGLFFLYLTNLSFILTPSVVTCTIRRFGTSSSYAVVFSGMMIKVWTVWKQIKYEKAEVSKPSTLIVLSLSFSGLQILFSGLWLMMVPPRIHYDSDKWVCYPSGELDSHLLVSMMYIIGILLATAVLAIQASAKNNNDETRWILISSALVSVLFSCWGIAIATGVWQNQRTAIMNLVSATILLSCMYIPKIRTHSKLKKSQPVINQPAIKVVEEFPVFTTLPPYPLVLDCNGLSPPSSSEDVSESTYSNTAFSIDESTESLPFEIDTNSSSDIDHEPLTFSTFFNDIQSAESTGECDPTQVVPSTLYSLDMFNNDPTADDKEHYEPGTNEFTPQHRISSQLYLYPPPEWVP